MCGCGFLYKKKTKFGGIKNKITVTRQKWRNWNFNHRKLNGKWISIICKKTFFIHGVVGNKQ